MTDLSPTLAPGCYGGAMLYKAEAQECKSCPFVGRCAPLATDRLIALRQKLGIREPVKKVVVKTPSAHPTGLPKKVAELLEKLNTAGVKIAESMRAGKNPFPTAGSKPAFLRVACHLLLALPDGIKRDVLCQAFMTKLNWTQGTAAAHALQAVQLLKAVGAATEENGTIKLRRN